MDLKDFIESHPQIAEYDESDSSMHKSILKLISKPMKLLGLSLAYERSPSFNALLRAQGIAFKTIISRRNGILTGLFSISSSPRYLQGARVQAAYLGDFRIENDLKIAAFWRKQYGQILNLFSQEPSLNQPKIFITAILKDNKLAQKTLVDNPRGQGEFKYHFLRSVDMINILSGPILRSGSTDTGYVVRFAKISEEQKLLDFIDQCEKEKCLGFNFKDRSGELWQQRLQHFPQFSISRFLIVETTNGDWIAVTLPASPDSVKRMTLQIIAWPIKTFFAALNIFGFNLPREGESLKTLYLTHFNIRTGANTKLVTVALLHFLHTHDVAKNYHMISFANWWNHSWKEYLTYSASINLYEVTSTNHTPQLAGKQDLTKIPLGFEMVLV
ncbi:MAG: hypothetical protein JNM24_14550 [Bdellovibrionaceae bacterium]|nr:hypothetical protein [Pseudobdellovibrionaceae bacterium]